MKRTIALIFTLVAGMMLAGCMQPEKLIRLGIHENHEGGERVVFTEDTTDEDEYDALKKLLMDKGTQHSDASDPDGQLYVLHFDRPRENVQELGFVFYLVEGIVVYQHDGDAFGYDKEKPLYELSEEGSSRLINTFDEGSFSN